MNSTEFHHILPYIQSTSPNIHNFTNFLYSLFSLPFSPTIETTNHTSHPILDYFKTDILAPSPFLASTIYSKLTKLSVSYVEHKMDIPITTNTTEVQYFTAQIFIHTDYEISDDIISSIFRMLNIFCHLYPQQMAEIGTFCLVWVPFEDRKRLHSSHIDDILSNTSSSSLTAEHINSAFTVFNMETPLEVPSILVFLYRSEDALKTVFHEMMHALRLDGNINSPMRENETYAETWALLLYLGCLSYHDLEAINEDDFHTNYITLLAIETAYSRIQAYKVIRLGEKAITDTNAFQYYVDKYYTLENIEEFLKWCEEHNQDWILFGGKYECDECAYMLFSANRKEGLSYMDVPEEYKRFLHQQRERLQEGLKKEITIPEEIIETMRMVLL